MALAGQRAVVGDTRQGDRIVAAPQVDRFVVEYAPPHRPLAFDERGDVGRRRQGERIADVVARIVVARDREGSVTAADAAQQTHGRRIEFRVADVDQIAAEDHQIGPQSVERVDQRPHLAVGVDERPDVQVGELCDAQPVERLRQPVAAERDAVYGQRAAARHGTDRCEDARRAAFAECAHDVVGHARQRE